MEFEIKRLSNEFEKPCENAYQKVVKFTEIYNSSELEYEKIHSEKWTDFGINHRIENNQLKRDFENVCWFIKFDNLIELYHFTNRYGAIIVHKNSITIYDRNY